MDIFHDAVQALIHFLGRPRESGRVLTHFETRHRHPAGVGGFSRSVEDTCLLENANGFGSGGHVGTFTHGHHAIGHEGTGIVAVNLVLRGRGESNVSRDVPRAFSFKVLRRGILLHILSDAAAIFVFQLHHVVELFTVDAVGIVDEPIGVGEGEHLAPQLEGFFDGVLRHVARTRHQDGLPLEIFTARFEHFHQEVDVAVACGFGTNEAAAKFQAFPCEDSLKLVGVLLVSPKHIAHFATPYADVAGGHITIGTDVAVEFEHKGLAETHHLGRTLTAWREVRTALCTAHRQRGEGVFEGLLESEKLENAEIDRTVKAQSAFVGADGVVVLHAIAHVGADVAFVVRPGDAESVDTLRNAKALDEVDALKFGMFVVFLFDGGEYLLYGLMILRFVGKSLFEFFQKMGGIHGGGGFREEM